MTPGLPIWQISKPVHVLKQPLNSAFGNGLEEAARFGLNYGWSKPMETIEFHAVVDQEQVIRPPNGVVLPRGEVEVTVRSRQPERTPSNDAHD